MSNYDDDATLGGWELDGTAWNAMAAEIETAYDYVSALTATTTQVNYLSTATSDIQTQLTARATLTGTQTLTNKTLGSGSAIDLGSDAEGDLYYRNSSGDLARLGIGTNGQTITSNGTVPGWSTPSSLIAKTTVDYIIYKSGGTSYGIDMSDGSTVASGTTDDVVIQAVIDDAEAAALRRIHIKKGSYTITNTLEVNSHIYLSGEGPEATELKAGTGLNADIMQINSAQSASQYRPIIDGIKFDGNNTNVTDGNCLTLYGCVEFRITNCHFEYYYDYGIYAVGTTGPTSGAFGHNGVIFNCLFDQSNSSGGSGIGYYQQWNDENHITDCKFQYNKWGIHDKQGLLDVKGCDFVNAGGGIWIEDASRTTVTACRFDRLDNNGVLCKGPFNNFVGNQFFSIGEGSSGSKSGIETQWYGHNTIIGNVFMAHDTGDSHSGVRESSIGDDTQGFNIICNNVFAQANGATSLGGTGWASADIVQTSADNVVANNVSN